ncbi:MAG: hypothetical protein LBV68_08560 [Spirochaetaceae bacterium]|jgi:hypothetical protein|nr:hypothetical protein [Spirochaetaceae bacterium]
MSVAVDTEDMIAQINSIKDLCLSMAKMAYKAVELQKKTEVMRDDTVTKKNKKQTEQYIKELNEWNNDNAAWNEWYEYDRNKNKSAPKSTKPATFDTKKEDWKTADVEWSQYENDEAYWENHGKVGDEPRKPTVARIPRNKPVKPEDEGLWSKDDAGWGNDVKHKHNLGLFEDRLNVAAFVTDNGIINICNSILTFAVMVADTSIKLRYNGDVAVTGAQYINNVVTAKEGAGPSAPVKYTTKMIKVVTGIGEATEEAISLAQALTDKGIKIDKALGGQKAYSVETL